MNAKESPSASTSFSVPLSSFSVSFLLQCLFSFVLFCSAPPSFFSVQHLLFSFLFSTSFLVLFQPYVFKVQPKTCCSPKSPLNLSTSCVPLYQDEVKPPASKPKGTRFSCQFSSQRKKIFLRPPFIQNPIFSLTALSLLFE